MEKNFKSAKLLNVLGLFAEIKMMLGTCKESLERRSEIWKECHRMWGRSCTASHKVRKELFFFFKAWLCLECMPFVAEATL